MKTPFGLFAMLCLQLLVAASAAAHSQSTSYLDVRRSGESLTLRAELPLRDLEYIIKLDDDGDNALRWGEVKRAAPVLIAFTQRTLALGTASGNCLLAPEDYGVTTHLDGYYAALTFTAQCPAGEAPATLRYSALFDYDQQHRVIVSFVAAEPTIGSARQVEVLTADRREVPLAPTSLSTLTVAGHFVAQGIWHIWLGYDHLLFLVALLLPAFTGKSRQLSATKGFLEVAKVVAAFTAAHSLTLIAAALGWIQLPPQLVEPVIALSVALAAINNLTRTVEDGRWGIAFGFGLIHGFGFASVLSELELPFGQLVTGLLSFNFGVEAGQMAVVLAVLPALYLVRNRELYTAYLYRGGSAMIAVLATIWVVERITAP